MGNGTGRGGARHDAGMRQVLAYCATSQHLRRTVVIAIVVGTILTVVNQVDVIIAGNATAFTAVKIAVNYLVPFIVSNLGLLAGRPRQGPTEE